MFLSSQRKPSRFYKEELRFLDEASKGREKILFLLFWGGSGHTRQYSGAITGSMLKNILCQCCGLEPKLQTLERHARHVPHLLSSISDSSRPLFCFILNTHLSVLRVYSWIFTQGYYWQGWEIIQNDRDRTWVSCM